MTNAERVAARQLTECAIPIWLQPLRPRDDDTRDNKEVFELLLAIDWGAKDPSLANLSEWPFSLRTMVQMILATDTPHCILWGKDLICIYNAAYWRHIALSKHPELMGMPAKGMFSGTASENKSWDPYKHILQACNTQRPVFVPETMWFREREANSDFVDEIYTSYKISTIYGDQSTAAGLLCVYTESTAKVISARRSRTLRALVHATQDLVSLNALKVKLVAAFNDCGLDFPICLVMLDKNFLAGDWSSSGETGPVVDYRCFIAVGMKRALPPRRVDFDQLAPEDASAEIPMFAELARRAHRVRGAFTFETDRFKEHCAGRAFRRPAQAGRMYPIYADESEEDMNVKPLGFLLLGVSPVRPLDEFVVEYANTADDLIKTAFRNFREVTRSKARLEEMNTIKKLGEQHFRALNDSPVGIAVQDWASKDLIFTNKRWMEIMGYEEGHAPNEWSDMIYPDDLTDIYRILSGMQPDGPPIEHMHRIKRLHSNGKPAWLTVNCSFYRQQLANDQMVTFMTTVIHDTSEQVYAKEKELASLLENQRLHAARALEAQRADAADSAKARQLDYIDTLAHEIRNPISAIVQTAELLIERLRNIDLNDDLLNDELQQSIDDLETIDICTTHMSRVINDTLNISKLEHGSLEVKLEPCDLIVHVSSVLRMLAQDMKNKDITCHSLIVEPEAVQSFERATTDPLRYKQIVLNLMTNAIKFTALQEGKREIAVRLSVKQATSSSDARMICSVRDTGRGMSAEAVQKLFGKFYQVSERTHIEYGGSGLGLFISQRLAVLLGGQIDVASEVGHGSVFEFSIPVRISDSSSVEPHGKRNGRSVPEVTSTLAEMELLGHRHSISSARAGSQSRRASPHPGGISRRGSIAPTQPQAPLPTSGSLSTILVVEDNLVNQKLMVKQLTMSGYRVLVGNHGLEALEHFKKGEHIDLVVTDIEMPIMNGVETLAAVRALDSTTVKYQPPFIACSAYAREEQKQAFIDAGMIQVIAKPHKFADLKKCVEHVLLHRMPLRREYTL